MKVKVRSKARVVLVLAALGLPLLACSSDSAEADPALVHTAGAGGQGTGGQGTGGTAGAGGAGAEGGGGSCSPAICQANSCGAPPDGCGGVLDCGPCSGLGQACGPDHLCSVSPLTLHAVPGCFLEVLDLADVYEVDVGAPGAIYAWLTIDYDTVHGGWRTDLYDRPVLNHNLVGLERNVTSVPGRYILGNAAQIKPAVAGLARQSIFYGRVDLEQKPPGEGWTGYQSFRDSFPWTEGETYHIHILLDAVARQQTLQISVGGQVQLTTVGDIPYYEPSLSTPTFALQVGGEESDDREVKPLGWQFCNLLVQAEELP